MDDVSEISVHELQAMVARGESFTLVDVREAHEVELCVIQGATHIPLGSLFNDFEQLDKERETVVYCHHGMRSAMATRFLTDKGFLSVRNLRGGIDAWADEVDPTVQKY